MVQSEKEPTLQKALLNIISEYHTNVNAYKENEALALIA